MMKLNDLLLSITKEEKLSIKNNTILQIKNIITKDKQAQINIKIHFFQEILIKDKIEHKQKDLNNKEQEQQNLTHYIKKDHRIF